MELAPYKFSHNNFAKDFETRQPGQQGDQKGHGRNVFRVFERQGGQLRKYTGWAVIGLFIAFFVLMFVFFMMDLVTFGFISLGLAFLGPAITYITAAIYWYYNIGPSLGEPHLQLDDITFRLGDTIHFKYEQEVLQKTSLKHGTLQLMARESVRYSCGTDTCYAQHDHFVDRYQFNPSDLPVGFDITTEGELQLPFNAMPTFVTDNNKIGWMLKLEMELETIGTYELFYQINVQPADQGAFS